MVTIGVNLPLEVFKTANGRGWGVRCSCHIPIGGFVCDYVGKLMTDTEAVSLAQYAMPLLWCLVCVICKRVVTGSGAVSHVASGQKRRAHRHVRLCWQVVKVTVMSTLATLNIAA